MLKNYIKMLCFTLAAMSTMFFAGNAYSVTVGQPQLDTPATAVNTPTRDTVLTVATTKTSANSSEQANANSSAANQQVPSANGGNIEYGMFRNTEGKPN
jgi:hypothetical protein